MGWYLLEGDGPRFKALSQQVHVGIDGEQGDVLSDHRTCMKSHDCVGGITSLGTTSEMPRVPSCISIVGRSGALSAKKYIESRPVKGIYRNGAVV